MPDTCAWNPKCQSQEISKRWLLAAAADDVDWSAAISVAGRCNTFLGEEKLKMPNSIYSWQFAASVHFSHTDTTVRTKYHYFVHWLASYSRQMVLLPPCQSRFLPNHFYHVYSIFIFVNEAFKCLLAVAASIFRTGCVQRYLRYARIVWYEIRKLTHSHTHTRSLIP